jgi:hypothetical protein
MNPCNVFFYFADLCVGVMYVLPELIIYRFNVGWEKYFCYILFGIKMLPIYASTFSIVVLTIDRMYAIIKPLNSAVKGLLYRFSLVATTWLLACLLTIPYFLHVTFTSDGLNECYFKATLEARRVSLYCFCDMYVLVGYSLLAVFTGQLEDKCYTSCQLYPL